MQSYIRSISNSNTNFHERIDRIDLVMIDENAILSLRPYII